VRPCVRRYGDFGRRHRNGDVVAELTALRGKRQRHRAAAEDDEGGMR
jgi:hypothetical protein